MSYPLAMSVRLLFVPVAILFMVVAAPALRADQVELQNGDRYSGKVLSVSADTVVLQNDVLGIINVPRKTVASLAFGTNAVAPKAASDVAQISVPTNLPAAGSLAPLSNTNLDLSAGLRNLGANTNVINQIREQLLAGNPEAASNYDDLVSGLMSGKVDMDDLRRQAQASADQLRELKRDLGPDAGDSIDAYLEVLDNFLNQTDATPASASPALQPKEDH
jgi:hypothetical protein